MFPQSLRTYSDPVTCDIMQQTEEYVAGRHDIPQQEKKEYQFENSVSLL